MTDDKIARLKAHALHDAVPMDVPIANNIHTVVYESGAMHFEVGDLTVYVGAQKDFLIIRGSDCGDAQIEAHEIDALIALLARARAIIAGGA